MHFAFGIIHGAGLLVLLVPQTALGQLWRKEYENEKPYDLEGSGDDDFIDEEADDVYSGSGSGDFELESRLDFGVRYTTETPVLPPTATALKPAPTVHTISPVQTTWLPPTTQETAVHQHYPWAPPETPSITDTPTPASPTKEDATAGIIPGTIGTTEIHRIQPILMYTSTIPVSSSSEEELETWEDTTEKIVTVPIQETSRQWPTDDERTILTTVADEIESEELDEVTPTQQPQTDSWEVTIATTGESEVETPAIGGPSGDFEIQEEDSKPKTQSPTIFDLGNEVLPPSTAPTDRGRGRKADTGLIDNTIDSGNTLAQMPQKNILERREVLIAVIVGGVVGALFAAFLVMLLIYRMKKKDEGSYALEEPKPASVSYQKPDNHEEFYA
ncbi:syndecan-3 [Gastrophryne carolinensis]